jgi:hypothetical protein
MVAFFGEVFSRVESESRTTASDQYFFNVFFLRAVVFVVFCKVVALRCIVCEVSYSVG